MTKDDVSDSLSDFGNRCAAVFRDLLSRARDKEPLQFAFALNPEMRGMQDAGWSTAEEALRSLDQYLEHINSIPMSPIRIRIGLSLYSHISEASGFYETLKNMLVIMSGGTYSMFPFRELVKIHRDTGRAIAPNANKVMQDLIGHAKTVGLCELVPLIQEAFDNDIRNAYAHADYILWGDVIRIRNRNGGHPKGVRVEDFGLLLNKAITFFQVLREVLNEFAWAYREPVTVHARMNSTQPPMYAKIWFDEETGRLSISANVHKPST